MARLSHYLKPVRLRIIDRLRANNDIPLRVLDIGCGNSSPTVTKKWLGEVEYHGVDIQDYANTSEDVKALDKLILVSVDDAEYSSIPDKYYDVIIMNHVLEHMSQPYKRLSNLLTKVKHGGIVWIAFPSMKSTSLPSADGSLNFFDDESHVHLPTIHETVNTLLESNVRVRYAGRSHDIIRWLIGVALLPWGVLKLMLTGRMCKGLWFVFGFETVIYGVKK